MHRLTNWIIALTLVLWASLSMAQDVPSPLPGDDEEESWSNIEVELTFQPMYFYYEEPGVMKELGMLWGFAGRATEYRASLWDFRWMFRVEGEYHEGDLTYDGQYSDGTKVTSDCDDWLYSIRGLVGAEFPLSNFRLTPYLGLAYRYWNNTIEGAGGYEREVSYIYSPMGLELKRSFDPGMETGLRAEYQLFWEGRVESHLSDSTIYDDVTNHQDMFSGHGFRGSLYFKYTAPKWLFSVEPYYQYWKVAESDHATLSISGVRVGEAWEPKNETHQIGLNISIGF